MDVFGHHALAGCATQLSRLQGHNKLVPVLKGWVFAPSPNFASYESIGLVPGYTDRPADFHLNATGVDSRQLDVTQPAVDVIVRDVVGSASLPKARRTAIVGRGVASSAKAEKESECVAKCRRSAAAQPD